MLDDREVLFLASIISCTADSVSEVKDWCQLVLERHEPAWKEQQRPGGAPWAPPAEWKKPGNAAVGTVLDAYKAEWPRHVLDRIATAMQLWRGRGQQDSMDADKLIQHRSWAQDKTVKKQGLFAARIRTALIPVARLLKSPRGAVLRALLAVEKSVTEVPTAVEALQTAQDELKASQAAQAKLVRQLTVAAKEKALVVDKHRKLKESKSKKTKLVMTARTEERKKAAIAKKNWLEVEQKKMAVRLAEAQERRFQTACSDVQHILDKMTKGLKKARARARNVEDSSKLSAKRLKRAQVAEEDVHKLQVGVDPGPFCLDPSLPCPDCSPSSSLPPRSQAFLLRSR